MKGFGIEIKNNLLETKHYKQMGVAVWLYMWLIDKMTSINEDGMGKVLGGKPIKYEEFKKEILVTQKTYSRWVVILRKAGYINTLRTPYGIVFTVNKAFKRFKGRCDKYVQESGKKRVCNIRQYNDINNKDTLNLKNSVNIKKNMDDYVLEEVDENGNTKVSRKKSVLPKTSKNKLARELQFEFQAMAKKFLRVDVIVDGPGYFSVLRALSPERGKMTPDQIRKLFTDWFMTQGIDRVTSITACLSNRNIEKYKIQHGIITK